MKVYLAMVSLKTTSEMDNELLPKKVFDSYRKALDWKANNLQKYAVVYWEYIVDLVIQEMDVE